MMNRIVLLGAVAAATVFGQTAPDKMTFFITSAGSGKGAELGGLEGADRICQSLAKAAGAGSHTWHAYLSTNSVNAKDRIGKGPWYNAKGVMVAKDISDLHSESNQLGKQNSLTEKGQVVNGRGDKPNEHDILTGSQMDGTAFKDGADHTCGNWSSSASTGSAQVGHHDRQGGGTNPNSWNSAHGSKGCGQADLVSTGGAGRFYCFAID